MPDIAAEAGLSVGASYRYFTGKDELILEIAGDAFRMIFDPVERLAGQAGGFTVADLVAAAVDPVSGAAAVDRAGNVVPVDELLRCGVQAWASCCATSTCASRPTPASSTSASASPRRSATDSGPAACPRSSTPTAVPGW